MKLLFVFLICFWQTKSLSAQESSTKQIDLSSFDFQLKKNSNSPIQEKIQLKKETKTLLAENTSTFDPFIDYGEFQDDVTEEESINFFHYGRSISIALAGGYEAVTFNIRQLYGDTGFVGVNASFFLDLRFAIQVSGVFPSGHHSSLYNTPFHFAHYGLDLKYYWNRQYLNKDRDFFSPYVIFGPFHLNTKSPIPRPQQTITPNPQNQQQPQTNLSQQERKTVASHNSAGIKIGFGFELALIQQSFIGFEITYLYSILLQENEDLSNQDFPPLAQTNRSQSILQRLQFPNRPEVQGFRFYGDLMNIGLVFGVNF